MKRELQSAGSGDTWLAVDGRVLQMRPIAEGDAAELVSFVRRLSFGARYFRYGRPDFDLTYERARQTCIPDRARRLHLLVLALINGSRSVVASGRIIFEPGEKHCQLEMAVSDAWQGQGLGRRLLDALIDAARQIGLQEMRATMLVTNTAASALLLRRGFLVGNAAEGESIRVARLDISSRNVGRAGRVPFARPVFDETPEFADVLAPSGANQEGLGARTGRPPRGARWHSPIAARRAPRRSSG
jgi:GNAT superfamily N-acetyltransferase